MLLLGRNLPGLAVGGISATVPTHLGEKAPAQIPGPALRGGRRGGRAGRDPPGQR
ncbi:MFS transporter [Streptomyces sp. NPDC126514]|uniref:MFS transporter n=1 Tax=Streptomyces sp. NPDC126514 TaxID=3155210 RepID=UPI0033340CD4